MSNAITDLKAEVKALKNQNIRWAAWADELQKKTQETKDVWIVVHYSGDGAHIVGASSKPIVARTVGNKYAEDNGYHVRWEELDGAMSWAGVLSDQEDGEDLSSDEGMMIECTPVIQETDK